MESVGNYSGRISGAPALLRPNIELGGTSNCQRGFPAIWEGVYAQRGALTEDWLESLVYSDGVIRWICEVTMFTKMYFSGRNTGLPFAYPSNGFWRKCAYVLRKLVTFWPSHREPLSIKSDGSREFKPAQRDTLRSRGDDGRALVPR